MSNLQIPPYFETKPLSRKDFFKKDDDDYIEKAEEDLDGVKRLYQLVDSRIQVDPDSGRAKKRRKVEVERKEEGPLLFRLVSGKGPIPVSLEPPPLPPAVLKIIEPEDDDDTAKRRHEIAQATAIDASWIMKESSIPGHRKSKVEEYKSSKRSIPTANMVVLSKLQAPRTSRPPVPANQLGYPYTETLKPVANLKACPTVELAQPHLSRRKRKQQRRQRPPPAFWTPPPNVTGKCVGYAYGYPSSFSNVERWNQRGILYRRDTMKKAKLKSG
ncbi:hypothetical protein CC1G_06272 [Coprinopsis cinerea okayama7|uniref:Uncharacterized protein n=1 Tax=Coprinopsis cinerea (strain Okayama-7 / 130 / ATCC MYA-4618 / FGSC 9003) TaxID=240176 RepID=A8NTB1_COPC7|nr:hypothetical protein CC1G_06272 [Coprinopsis cinerea okayama7\|eukprot:XP_001836187.1 hypothetical protein CC1G_06272 [Coprinopsis cinerea okayama7\